MMRRCMLVGLLALSLNEPPAWYRIKLLHGTPNVVNGSLTEMSPAVVKIEVGQIPKSYAVNLIDYIEFDEDPRDLKNARTAMKAGKFKKCWISSTRSIRPTSSERKSSRMSSITRPS